MSPPPQAWPIPPSDIFQNLRNSAHVWRLNVGEAAPPVPWEGFLIAEERDRAARFHFEADRRRFGKARGGLRYLLGRYLKRDPLEILLVTDENGRPRLDTAHRLETVDQAPISFSVSHSGDVGLIAVSSRGPIGVDVEKIREDFSGEKIAARFFSEGENLNLAKLSPQERKRAFFDLWTLKEAFFKAKGEGLLLPLNRFEIAGDFEGRFALTDLSGQEDLSRWCLKRLPEAAKDHTAAAAWVGAGFLQYCDGDALLSLGAQL